MHWKGRFWKAKLHRKDLLRKQQLPEEKEETAAAQGEPQHPGEGPEPRADRCRDTEAVQGEPGAWAG